MGEIKFRAWDGRKFWHDVAVMDSEPYVQNFEETGLVPLFTNDQIAFYGKPIVEQYTGLKDKNGKYIYEGDILRGGMLDEACCVEWQDNTGQYVAWGEHYNVYGHRFDQFEVIGNIHENPELIK